MPFELSRDLGAVISFLIFTELFKQCRSFNVVKYDLLALKLQDNAFNAFRRRRIVSLKIHIKRTVKIDLCAVSHLIA